MKEHLNENTLFNTLAMFLDESEALLLIVEGPDDRLLLQEFCTRELQLMAATGGRHQALSAAKLASERGVSRARFLVDRDFDSFTGSTATQLENVFVSDNHDCFLDIIHAEPSLLPRVIDVHCDSGRRRVPLKTPIPDSADMEKQAFSLATMLTAIKIVDARNNLHLDFKRFHFGDLSTRDFDVVRIAEIVLERCQFKMDAREEIIGEAVSTYSEVMKMRHLPVGDHDLFSALARIMKRYGVSVKSADLCKGLILKVTCLTLSKTGWYQLIQHWCESHGREGFTCEPCKLAA